MRLRFGLPLIAGTLILAGCAREGQAPPPQPGPRSVPAKPPVAPVPSAADYVAIAASGDLFVIRSSQLALTRSGDPKLKAYARDMIAAHSGTSGQLSLAGRRLNLLPSLSLRPEHEALMRELLLSPDFDRLFWRQHVTLHGQAIENHERFALRGQSPTLRPVAKAALEIERRHLQQLRAMR